MCGRAEGHSCPSRGRTLFLGLRQAGMPVPPQAGMPVPPNASARGDPTSLSERPSRHHHLLTLPYGKTVPATQIGSVLRNGTFENSNALTSAPDGRHKETPRRFALVSHVKRPSPAPRVDPGMHGSNTSGVLVSRLDPLQ